MEWNQVKLPEPSNTRIQAGALSRLDYYKLRVITKLIGKSAAAVYQTAILTYLDRTWAKHEERLTVEAASQGISVEELFTKLASEAE